VLGRMNAIAALSASFLIFLCGCTLSGRPHVARSQILRQVPIGTSIDDATNRLTHAGFRCAPPLRGSVFYDMAVTPRFTHTNATVMFCDRTRTMYFGHRRWVIGLPYDERGSVTNIFVQVWDRYWMEL
jgi:hypothetical protein